MDKIVRLHSIETPNSDTSGITIETAPGDRILLTIEPNCWGNDATVIILDRAELLKALDFIQ